MKVRFKLLSMAGPPPAGFDEFGENTLDLGPGTSVADAVAALKLSSQESYTTILNGEAVPPGARAGQKLADGDEITLFPAIQGG
jgi:thiamine biosynthesis protein ThiS